MSQLFLAVQRPSCAMQWALAITTAFAVLLTPSVRAADGAAGVTSGSTAATTTGAKMLARIQAAARDRNYQGTLVNAIGGALSSSRVAHYVDAGQAFERVEALDGQQQRVFRHNDQVLTLMPGRKLALVEQRDLRQGLPSMAQTLEPRVEELYEVRLMGTDRVANREAQIILLKPRDDWRFAQRIWADQQTGLMLRAEVLGPRDDVLEASGFTDVEIGMKPQPDNVLQAMRRLEGYKVVRHVPQAVQPESEGWLMGQGVPGFKLSSCVKRALHGEQDGDAATAGQVLQAVYSDGLTHVSVFIERFDEARHRKPLMSQFGATHTLMQRHGNEHWVTVVGDVPMATLKQFHKSLERRR